MRKSVKSLFLCLSIALVLSSCCGPLLSVDRGKPAQVSLSIAMPDVPEIRAALAPSSRALDPATSTVTMTVSGDGMESVTKTASATGMPPSATLTIEVLSGPNRTIRVEAYRSGESAPYATWQETRTLSAGSNPVAAFLKPTSSTDVASAGETAAITGVAGKTAFITVRVPFAGDWTFSLDPDSGSVPSGAVYYAWDGDGKVLGSWDASARSASLPGLTAGSTVIFGLYNAPAPHTLRVIRPSSGAIDSGFGASGFAGLQIGGTVLVKGSARQNDGKYVVVGNFVSSAPGTVLTYGFIGRLNADGTADTSFGGGKGYTLVKDGNPLYQYHTLNCAVILPDGRIAAGGTCSQNGSAYENLVVKLNSDGSYDGSFASGVVIFTAIGGSKQELTAIGTDGTCLYAAGNDISSGTHAYIVKLTEMGTFDTSWGLSTGIHDLGMNTKVFALQVRADLSVSLSGWSGTPSTHCVHFYVSADGSLSTPYTFTGPSGYSDTLFYDMAASSGGGTYYFCGVVFDGSSYIPSVVSSSAAGVQNLSWAGGANNG